MAESTRIGEESRVTLHFALKLEDGNVVDSTFDKQPASFKVGDGNLLPGFEQALFGLKAGDKRTLSILPEQGFGQPNPQNVQIMPRDQFPGHGTGRGPAGDLQRRGQDRTAGRGQGVR